MATEAQRESALRRIRENIARTGHHVYVVAGGDPTPRFAYTIGMSNLVGAELIFAGGAFYSNDEVVKAVNEIAASVKDHGDKNESRFEIAFLGSFSLRKVDPSWTSMLIWGALDFYGNRNIPGLQIVPDDAHWSIDVPDMSQPWSAKSSLAWRWLKEAWTYPVPSNSVAATDLGALRGERITEATRWEQNEWELFAGAGPDIPQERLRKVPLAVLLAADPSLEPVVSLPVGGGIWRDETSQWHVWE